MNSGSSFDEGSIEKYKEPCRKHFWQGHASGPCPDCGCRVEVKAAPAAGMDGFCMNDECDGPRIRKVGGGHVHSEPPAPKEGWRKRFDETVEWHDGTFGNYAYVKDFAPFFDSELARRDAEARREERERIAGIIRNAHGYYATIPGDRTLISREHLLSSLERPEGKKKK